MKIKSIVIGFFLIFVVSTPVIGIEYSTVTNDIMNNSFLSDPDSQDFLSEKKPFMNINHHFEQRFDYIDVEIGAYNEDLVSLFEQLDVTIYLGYLENITAFGPRVTGTPECEDAGEYIYNEFSNMGLEVRYHYWEYDDEWFGNNIEATYYGKNTESDEIYITCAHYDSVTGSPGADDDGSGVALVLSAAYLMRNAEFNNTIRFVTFSGEEQGLIGSYFYVEEAVQNEDNIKAVLNVDMIGFAITQEDEGQIKVYDDDESIWITDFTEEIADLYNSQLGLEIIRAGYSYGSDHYYFWEAGYNAVFYHEKNFNDYYHSSEDIIENMNINYAIKVSKLIIATLAELSGFITLNAPYKPSKPLGEIIGKIGTEYIYSTSTSDPQSDQISYLFDWGDGTDSGWIGPIDSGTIVEASHSWTNNKKYDIKVKAKDTAGYESDWSETLSVTIPRNRLLKIGIFTGLLEQIKITLFRINKLFS